MGLVLFIFYMIPVIIPKVPYSEDPKGWENFYIQRQKRREEYKYMFQIDKNEFTYVYGLIEDGEIVYVGVSKQPYTRYKDHLRNKFNNNWEVTITLLGKGERKEMLIVEHNLIKKYQPVYNIRK